ncbi:unnamed protein product [Lampetra fluviatilis]
MTPQSHIVVYPRVFNFCHTGRRPPSDKKLNATHNRARGDFKAKRGGFVVSPERDGCCGNDLPARSAHRRTAQTLAAWPPQVGTTVGQRPQVDTARLANRSRSAESRVVRQRGSTGDSHSGLGRKKAPEFDSRLGQQLLFVMFGEEAEAAEEEEVVVVVDRWAAEPQCGRAISSEPPCNDRERRQQQQQRQQRGANRKKYKRK